ncbi:hypothetical protein, partial [Photobacterium sanctipauli]|uniref:hypothetical protein n=1 Tax=Photobacterium sanctipauli TaxID=1342794 RepID=UPI0005623634
MSNFYLGLEPGHRRRQPLRRPRRALTHLTTVISDTGSNGILDPTHQQSDDGYSSLTPHHTLASFSRPYKS